MSSELEANVVSIERINEYIDIEPEADWITDNVQADWPTTGEIDFVNYSMRYKPGADLILKDISFKVKPNEKVSTDFLLTLIFIICISYQFPYLISLLCDNAIN